MGRRARLVLGLVVCLGVAPVAVVVGAAPPGREAACERGAAPPVSPGIHFAVGRHVPARRALAGQRW